MIATSSRALPRISATAFCAVLLLAATVLAQPASRLPDFPATDAPRAHGFVESPTFAKDYAEKLKVYGEKRDLPSNFSWVDLDGVTRVKSQGSCGSCWAFAAVAQIESHIKIEYGIDMDLSEQQMIECNPYGADCGGGWASAVYNVAMTYGAIRNAAEPYESSNGGACTQTESLPFGFVADWNYVSNDVTQIKNALLEGPVCTSIIGSDPDFEDYSGGCYDKTDGSWTDHLVLIVGWDDRLCTDGAWIIKNSWDTDWGSYGYGNIAYGAALIGSNVTQINYVPPPTSVTLTSPLAATPMEAHEPVDIQWSTSGEACSTVDIYVAFDGGEYETRIAQGEPNDGSFTWTVVNESSDDVRFLVVADGDTRQGFGFSPEAVRLNGYRSRYVSSAGSDTPPYDSPASAAHSIGDAVNACTGRDTVKVVAGDYLDTILVEGTVMIEGGWSADFATRDPVATPTRLRGLNSCVRFMGDADELAGVDGVIFYDCIGAIFDTPVYGRHGGAILCNGTSPVIRDCVFDNCATDFGTDFGTGGAIQIVGGSPQIIGCEFLNGNGAWGGAVAMFDPVDAVFRDNLFDGNTNEDVADGNYGAAVYLSGGSASFEGDVFTNNGTTFSGGAVHAENAALSLTDVTVDGNAAQVSGGGVAADGCDLTLHGTVLRNNQTASGSGGGMHAKNSTLEMLNGVVQGNTSTLLGGGLNIESTLTGRIENTVLYGNSDGSGFGGVFMLGAGPMTFRNNVVCGNVGGVGGSVASLTLDYNDVWDNGGSDYLSVTPGASDISADPLFKDPVAGDFGLTLHSPCLDRGDPEAACADPDGSRADMGRFGGPDAATPAPAAVAGARAESVEGTPSVAWDANLEGDVDRYVVYFDPAMTPPLGISQVFAEVDHPATSVPTGGGVGSYYVVAVDVDGYVGGYSEPVTTTTSVDGTPRALALASVSPNPFNPSTTITYEVPRRAEVELYVYDMRGRVVTRLVDETLDAGVHEATWTGRDASGDGVAAGVYLLRLNADGESRTTKLVMAK